jgi:hypothetical protein
MPDSEGTRMQDLAGTMWKVIEAHAFDESNREIASPIGPSPTGFAIFDAKRMLASVIDNRAVPSDAPSRFFVAYSGPYSFDGSELVTRADRASASELLVEQIRRIRFEGPKRMIVAPVSGLPSQGARLEIVWERVG